MTYCLGMRLRDGLVMLADTRTNAGIDNLATYRKLRIVVQDDERFVVVASAGSLSTTQIAIERAIEGIVAPDTRQLEPLRQIRRIHRAAYLVGQALRITTAGWRDVTEPGLALDGSFLVGGCVKGEPTRLFLIYGEGNFIECGPDTPFLQIGERKYGQPLLDRRLTYDLDLNEALKLGLLSFDSTMKSNRAVDMPIDLVVIRDGETRPELTYRIDASDAYFAEMDAAWSEALATAVAAVPDPPYGKGLGADPPWPPEAIGPAAVRITADPSPGSAAH